MIKIRGSSKSTSINEPFQSMYGRDLFVLIPTSRTSMNRWENQYHARKVHSYLWVFDVTIPRAKVLDASKVKGNQP